MKVTGLIWTREVQNLHFQSTLLPSPREVLSFSPLDPSPLYTDGVRRRTRLPPLCLVIGLGFSKTPKFQRRNPSRNVGAGKQQRCGMTRGYVVTLKEQTIRSWRSIWSTSRSSGRSRSSITSATLKSFTYSPSGPSSSANKPPLGRSTSSSTSLDISTSSGLPPLARALAYCHEKKVIHWDLKPENLLLDIECRPTWESIYSAEARNL